MDKFEKQNQQIILRAIDMACKNVRKGDARLPLKEVGVAVRFASVFGRAKRIIGAKCVFASTEEGLFPAASAWGTSRGFKSVDLFFLAKDGEHYQDVVNRL